MEKKGEVTTNCYQIIIVRSYIKIKLILSFSIKKLKDFWQFFNRSNSRNALTPWTLWVWKKIFSKWLRNLLCGIF